MTKMMNCIDEKGIIHQSVNIFNEKKDNIVSAFITTRCVNSFKNPIMTDDDIDCKICLDNITPYG